MPDLLSGRSEYILTWKLGRPASKAKTPLWSVRAKFSLFCVYFGFIRRENFFWAAYHAAYRFVSFSGYARLRTVFTRLPPEGHRLWNFQQFPARYGKSIEYSSISSPRIYLLLSDVSQVYTQYIIIFDGILIDKYIFSSYFYQFLDVSFIDNLILRSVTLQVFRFLMKVMKFFKKRN